MRRRTYEEVKTLFEEASCVLLSTEYHRAKDKLRYICSCGNESEIVFDKFRVGQRCSKCKVKKMADKTRKSYDEVSQIFKDGGCVLLTTEYIDNKQKLSYICECGNEAEIALTKFMAGQRCQICKSRKLSERMSGTNSPNYKHDRTDEERVKQRKYPAYIKWRESVYQRDDYTCVNCGRRGCTINAHHIYSYIKFPELRTDVRNGITLCYECHRRFHKAFGISSFEPGDTQLFLSGVLDERPF